MKCDGCGHDITSGLRIPFTGELYCTHECFDATQVEEALAPDLIDSQRDTISRSEIRKAAEAFMADRARRGLR